MIDSATLITGSFNFTKAAEEKNAENLLVIKDAPGLVKAYEATIRMHAGHSHPYQRQADAGSRTMHRRLRCLLGLSCAQSDGHGATPR